MSTLLKYIIDIGILIAFVVLVAWLDLKFPCACGRERRPYFFKDHEKLWLMIVYSLLATFSLVVFVITINWTASIIMALFSTYDWYRVYYHEKDKIKKAARSLGRVIVGDHGKLKVVNN